MGHVSLCGWAKLAGWCLDVIGSGLSCLSACLRLLVRTFPLSLLSYQPLPVRIPRDKVWTAGLLFLTLSSCPLPFFTSLSRSLSLLSYVPSFSFCSLQLQEKKGLAVRWYGDKGQCRVLFFVLVSCESLERETKVIYVVLLVDFYPEKRAIIESSFRLRVGKTKLVQKALFLLGEHEARAFAGLLPIETA